MRIANKKTREIHHAIMESTDQSTPQTDSKPASTPRSFLRASTHNSSTPRQPPAFKLVRAGSAAGSLADSEERKLKLTNRSLTSSEVQAAKPESSPLTTPVTTPLPSPIRKDRGTKVFTKPPELQDSHVPLYAFTKLLISHNQKNWSVYETQYDKSLTTIPTIPVPIPDPSKVHVPKKSSVKILRNFTNENKNQPVNTPPDTPHLLSQSTESISVQTGSFVIVFPGGVKKSWRTIFLFIFCLKFEELNPSRVLLPLIVDQCEIRRIPTDSFKVMDFEGKPITLQPKTTMGDIENSLLYVK